MNFDDTIMKDYQTELVMLDARTQSDSYGGIERVYSEGAHFTAVMTQPQSGTAEVAQAITQTKSYKIVTGTNILLSKGDYIKRVQDGKTFRIQSDNYDRLAPDDSPLQMRVTTAEEVELP